MTNEDIVLAEIRKNIRQLSGDDQIRIQCIASTLRNVMMAEPLAPLAFALVGAEAAAKAD